MAYRVVDSPFNRANYPEIIGQVLDHAPSYAQVEPADYLPVGPDVQAGAHGFSPYVNLHDWENDRLRELRAFVEWADARAASRNTNEDWALLFTAWVIEYRKHG